MIHKTEAIVLKTMKYRETSKLVTLYTRKFGKINVVAKGAMLTTSKFGASLEPMSHILAVLYKKETRELQYLSQAETINPFLEIYPDYKKSSIGLSICELVYKAIKFEEENQKIFNLLVNVLTALNEAKKNYINFLWFFIVHFLEILGFKINFYSCANCGAKFSEGNLPMKINFLSDKGGFLCERCALGIESISVSISAFKSLRWIEKARVENVANLKIPPDVNSQIQSLLISYLKLHVESLPDLKSLEIYHKL